MVFSFHFSPAGFVKLNFIKIFLSILILKLNILYTLDVPSAFDKNNDNDQVNKRKQNSLGGDSKSKHKWFAVLICLMGVMYHVKSWYATTVFRTIYHIIRQYSYYPT